MGFVNLDTILFIDSLPTLDLHSLDRETARVFVEDFIRDQTKMKNEFVVIIHGIHGGILRNTVKQVLEKNKNIIAFKIYPYNVGCTIAQLKVDKL